MDKKPSLLQFTMTYGLILGAASILFSLILYISGFLPYNLKRMLLTSLISIAITVFFVVKGSKAYRDKVLDGYISYGQAVLTGLLIVVMSTVISSFYSLIFNLYIDPDYAGKLLDATKEWTYNFMTNMGATDEQIDEAIQQLELQESNSSPVNSFFQVVYLSSIYGIVLSLITSAFIKKEKNPMI